MSCIRLDSPLGNALVKLKFTDKEIAKVDLAIQDEQFKQWYGNVERDSFGYPYPIKGIYLTNEKGVSITLNDLLNGEDFEQRKFYKADLTYIDKVKTLLKDLKAAYETRINNFKDSEYADKLEEFLKEVNKIDAIDYISALNLHTENILKTVASIENRFVDFDKVNKAKLDKKQLEDYEVKFKNFLIQSNSFLSTFDKIDQLDTPKIEGLEVNKLIKLLKDTENKVTELRHKINAEAEAVTRNKIGTLIKDPNVRNGVIDFLAAQVDENGAQRWLDALGDSHIHFLAGIDKFYKRNMFEKDEEVKEMQKEWRKFIKDFNGNFDDFLNKILETEDGKRTGKFIDKYSEAYNKALYYYTNVATQEDYDAWFDKNHDKNGNPKSKWINDAYEKLSDSEKESFEKVKKMLSYLVEHSKDNVIKQGGLPAIPKEDIKEEKAKDPNKPVIKTITESGDIVKYIPFKYIKRLNQKELPEVKDGMTEEEIEEIQKQRKEISKTNRLAHGEAVNYNLAETMEFFIEAALTNKYKTRMEADMKLFQIQMKQMNVIKTTAKGETTFDKIQSTVKGENVAHEISSSGSNMEKHFIDWMEGVFYEDFELEEKLKPFADKIQNFTSLRNIGFNVLSGLNNQITGQIMTRIESAGGRYFTYKDYRDARKLYYSNSMTMIADRNKKESSNLLTAYLKELNIILSQDELLNKPNGALATAKHKAKMLIDAAYFMQHIGEHQIQNASLIAMSMSHRIIDGEIMSFNEFFEKKKFNIAEIHKNESLEAALQAIEDNKEMKKELETEFEQYTKVIDAYELIDGYAKLKKDSGVTQDMIFDFRERVLGVNQRMHGIYNTDDAAMLQRYALGRLGMQFRKWMRPSWNRRFGRKFGKTLYNERIRDYEAGMYTTTAKYLASPFTKNYEQYRKQQEAVATAVFHAMVAGFKELVFNSKIRWHSMTEIEKADVRRTAAEFLFLTTIVALGFLAKNLKAEDDDDDKLKQAALIYTLYEADRLYGELTTFNIGIANEGSKMFSSPAPSIKTLQDITKLSSAIFAYPFRTDAERVFKGGIHSKHDKVGIYLQDMIPFWRHYRKVENLRGSTNRYGMFSE